MQTATAILPKTPHSENPQHLAAKSPGHTSANRLAFGPVEQPPLKTALTIVSRSTQTRASNAARAALVVANVTPTGYRVGIFMANHARYAKLSDIRRNVSPGEIFTYWPQAKVAAEMGCSERQVRRGVRSLREAGALEVRRRVRPCEASYVWVQPVRSDVRSDGECVLSDVRSGVLSGVRSHTEPRTEPQKNHVGSSSRARVFCPCGNSWPAKAEYGTTCYECGYDTSPAEQPADDPKACTCGDGYLQSYGRRCVDCEGRPSPAQLDAVRPASTAPPIAETEKHDGGVQTTPVVESEDDPPPKSDPDALLRFWKDARAQYGRKQTPSEPMTERTHTSVDGRAACCGCGGPRPTLTKTIEDVTCLHCLSYAAEHTSEDDESRRIDALRDALM